MIIWKAGNWNSKANSLGNDKNQRQKKNKTKTKKISVITFLTFHFPITAMPKTLLFKQGRKSVKYSVNNIFKFSSFLNLGSLCDL